MKDRLCRWLGLLAGGLLMACAFEFPRVAVLDRIVDGGHAVLLVGEPPELEVITPVAHLPENVRAGDWLRVTLRDGRVVSASIDHSATEHAQDRVRDKLEALRERGRRLE